MKKDLKTKWVKALRSGDYKQGTGKLKPSHDTYCCLGVLCEMAEIPQNEFGSGFEFQGERFTSTLGYAVRTELGLQLSTEDILVDMNDTMRCSFSHIADYIEKCIPAEEDQ